MTSTSPACQVHALHMLRRLRHPNLVMVHGAAPLPETFDLALVMERRQMIWQSHHRTVLTVGSTAKS